MLVVEHSFSPAGKVDYLVRFREALCGEVASELPAARPDDIKICCKACLKLKEG